MSKKGKPTGAAQLPTNVKPKADVYISFNKAETAALSGVCLRSLRVYFELKWLANFRTGVVGAFGRQKLTYEAIANKVAIPTAQGRSTASNYIDGKEVARIIERLEQAGLVADVQNSKEGLTLSLPMSPMRLLQATTQQPVHAPPQAMPISGQNTQVQPVTLNVPIQVPQQEPKDEDDWDLDWPWDEPESATSPATSTESAGDDGAKLPTVTTTQSVANPHEQRGCGDPIATQSVLVKTEGQYSFSVHGPVLDASARSALASAGTAGAPTEPLGEPHPLAAEPFRGEETPSLDAEQIRERIRARHPGFSYLDTQVSTTIFERIATLGVNATELDDAAQSLTGDPMQKLTAGSLFDRLVSIRRRPRRLLGGVVL